MFLLIKRYFVKRKKTKCDYNCEHKDIEIYSPKEYKCYLKQVLTFYAFRAAPSPFFFHIRIDTILNFLLSLLFLLVSFRWSLVSDTRPFHCSHGEVLHVKFMYQCPVSSAVLLLSTSTFLNPTQLSASVQCPVPSCFLAQLLTTILLMVPSYHVWSTECVQSMLMERCTENQLSILHPSQLTARTLDIGSPDFVLWGMSRLSQKGAKLDMRDEPEAKLRCLSKCYAVHLGVSDTCPEQFGIKAFHRYFAVMTRTNNGHHTY
ncbi:hypothetical protein J3Q64DRAFT_1693889 [Phycomyces blakesleeanus]|uniref:Uncharacterized protein n=1 Tax=Phycomyces blakesleeanus TaxID=4837 RepID=A0ABR3BGE3_PHYBL